MVKIMNGMFSRNGGSDDEDEYAAKTVKIPIICDLKFGSDGKKEG